MQGFVSGGKWACLSLGVLLLATNLYGLGQSLRPASFSSEDLRFGDSDISLSLSEYQQSVQKLPRETDLAFATRLTKVISQGTAHVEWELFDPEKFNQRVPFWENWILNLMGRFSGIPEFERYHFVNPEKSMERGIGICGEVSMLMTSLLEQNNIEASLVTVPGHVMVSAKIDGKTNIFDPDFGVVLPFAIDELKANAEQASQLYLNAGYKPYDKVFFQKVFSEPYRVWNGAEHFITKKYYFEKVSYWLIWIIPVCMLLISNMIGRKSKH
jgi:hypothetical protein